MLFQVESDFSTGLVWPGIICNRHMPFLFVLHMGIRHPRAEWFSAILAQIVVNEVFLNLYCATFSLFYNVYKKIMSAITTGIFD